MTLPKHSTASTVEHRSIKQQVISLYVANAGQWVRIHSLPEGILGSHFIRFGIHKGEKVQCIERLPGGTVVIQKNRQQIAIGHSLAKQIFVVLLLQPEE